MISLQQLENVPRELRERRQWVAYRAVPSATRPGRVDKIPVNPANGRNASTTDPATWGTCSDALSRAERDGLAGVGFVFTADDPYVGIDLDHCVNESSELEPWAEDIAQRLATYAEWSPSGTGVHIIAKGELPPGRRKTGSIEMYSSGRFFTITGSPLPSAPASIGERTPELEELYLDTFGEDPNDGHDAGGGMQESMPVGPLVLDDSELLRRAHAAANGALFGALWRGDCSSYPSQSEADLALTNLLAFWTGPDPQWIDRLFRQSGLHRDKWDQRHDGAGRTYGQMTIDRVLDSRCTYYSPGRHANSDGQNTNGSGQSQRKKWALSDLGNAERLVHYHGNDLHYCYEWGKWLAWNGSNWQQDDEVIVVQRAKDTVRRIYDEAAGAANDEERQPIARWALRSETKQRIDAMIDLARSEPGIAISSSWLDSDPMLLNCLNGTLDLRTGELRPHDRSDLCAKIAPVVFDRDASSPLWDRFLDVVTGRNIELKSFLRRCIGYTLTGDITEQVLLFLHGNGSNGKTTFVEAIRSILGDYAQKAPQEMITMRRFDGGVPNHVARLQGARMAVLNEVEEGRYMAEAQVKDLTGGDRIPARHMRAEWFDFTPTHKLWVCGNHKPVIRGTDNGIWRRIRLIPFTVTVPEDQRDPHLKERLLAEGAGILAWAVRGCLDWQREGLGTPEIVQVATNSYRGEMDVLGQFLEDSCLQQPTASVPKGELYTAYEAWCEQSGERPIAKRTFGQRLREKGFEERKSGTHLWVGIGLLQN